MNPLSTSIEPVQAALSPQENADHDTKSRLLEAQARTVKLIGDIESLNQLMETLVLPAMCDATDLPLMLGFIEDRLQEIPLHANLTPAAQIYPVVRLTPAQQETAVAYILEIVDETLSAMERNPRKWGRYINPRRMLAIWVKYRPRGSMTPADIPTIQASLDSLFQRHMKPVGAPEDYVDWARRLGDDRPESPREWSWWGDIIAENNELHVAKLQEFRAIVASGDIDPNPAPL